MKRIAWLIGALASGVGVVGLVAPAKLLGTAQSMLSPLGLYLAAAVRLLAAGVLLAAAPRTRAPTFLRVLGIILILNGITTVFLGVDRARAMLARAAALDSTIIRAGALLALGVGVFVCYAVSGTAEPKTSHPNLG